MQYFMYKYVNDKWTFQKKFQTYDDLIRFLYYTQKNPSWHDLYIQREYKHICWSNDILDNINMNGNDVYKVYKSSFINGLYNTEIVSLIRPYMFFDEKNKIVDVRNFHEDVKNYKVKTTRYHFWHGGKYTYDPCRKMNRGSTVRMIQHPDFKKYNRLSRFQYFDRWDYPYKHCDRSWKTSYKVRKQWQKNKK